MTPDSSRWRQESAYEYFDGIPASGLAWECLRRNPDYQQDYALTLKPTADLKRLEERFLHRWGVRFPCSAKPKLAGTERLLDARKS